MDFYGDERLLRLRKEREGEREGSKINKISIRNAYEITRSQLEQSNSLKVGALCV